MVAFKGHYDGRFIVPDEPVSLPRGQSLMVHVENTPGEQNIITGAQLAESSVVGLWRDRSDVQDSLSFARQLRRTAENRDQAK